jgi:uncharacterized protein
VTDDARAVGRVEQIWVYPVRSLAGATLQSATIGSAGLAGDRVHTVVDEAGGPVRAKDAPALASLPPDVDAAALSAAVGRTVRLEPLPPAPGVAPVHLVSRQAIDRAARGEVPEGCSADDPRANLVLALDHDDERSWTGRLVRVGDAVLEITRTPKHCLGVYADVRTPGEVRVGDAVLL